MKKRLISILCLILALALVFVGCGNKKDSNDDEDEEDETTTEAVDKDGEDEDEDEEEDGKSSKDDEEVTEDEEEEEEETEDEDEEEEETKKPAKKEDSIEGTWVCEADMSEYLTDMLAGEDEDMGSYFDIKDICTYLVFEFDGDGNAVMYFDADKTAESMSELGVIMYDGMLAYLEDNAEDLGVDDAEAYMEEMGLTRDTMGELVGIEDMADALGEIGFEFEYTYEDGVLTLDGEDYDCEIDGDEMILDIDPEVLDMDEEMAEYLLPMVLTRD